MCSCHVTCVLQEKKKNQVHHKVTHSLKCLSQHVLVDLGHLFTFLLVFLSNTMPKCIRGKKDFNAQGFSTHRKSCKPYKHAIKTHSQNVTFNEEIVTETAGELADLGEMFVDNVQVLFSSLEN